MIGRVCGRDLWHGEGVERLAVSECTPFAGHCIRAHQPHHVEELCFRRDLRRRPRKMGEPWAPHPHISSRSEGARRVSMECGVCLMVLLSDSRRSPFSNSVAVSRGFWRSSKRRDGCTWET
jgi:hypothetical protein